MKGQGLIEVIYAIGILGLVMTGVVILILMAITNNKNDYDRKKAVELGTRVIEDMVDKNKNDVNNFWNFNSISNLSVTGYDNFVYSIGFTNISNDVRYPNCGVGVTDCVEVNVRVDWMGKEKQSVYFNRFFSKNAY